MNYFMIILTYIFLSQFIFAQNPQWWIYDTSNSPLPSNSIATVVEDNNQNFWIGTYPKGNQSGGLAKFDGSNWTVYDTSNSPLPDNHVQHLSIDEQGNLWIATFGGGAARFDGTNWTIFDTTNSGLPTNDVLYIAHEQNGTRWFGTYWEGLVKYDGVSWNTYTTSNSGLPGDEINIIVIDSLGNKWIGTDGGGLGKYDGENWTKYSYGNFLHGYSAVVGFAIDNQGDNWVTAVGDPIITMAKFNDTSWTLFGDTTIGFHLPVTFGGIAIDDADTKWIATINGLVRYDDVDWIFYDSNNTPLPADWIMALYIDQHANKWMGLFSGSPLYRGEGLAVFNENGISFPLVSISGNGDHNLPKEIHLFQNYPNPFNAVTRIKYSIPSPSRVALKVFDLHGKEVAEIVNDHQDPGNHEVLFDAGNLSSGIYFYQLSVIQSHAGQSRSSGITKKLILIK